MKKIAVFFFVIGVVLGWNTYEIPSKIAELFKPSVKPTITAIAQPTSTPDPLRRPGCTEPVQWRSIQGRAHAEVFLTIFRKVEQADPASITIENNVYFLRYPVRADLLDWLKIGIARGESLKLAWFEILCDSGYSDKFLTEIVVNGVRMYYVPE